MRLGWYWVPVRRVPGRPQGPYAPWTHRGKPEGPPRPHTGGRQTRLTETPSDPVGPVRLRREPLRITGEDWGAPSHPLVGGDNTLSDRRRTEVSPRTKDCGSRETPQSTGPPRVPPPGTVPSPQTGGSKEEGSRHPWDNYECPSVSTAEDVRVDVPHSSSYHRDGPNSGRGNPRARRPRSGGSPGAGLGRAAKEGL